MSETDLREILEAEKQAQERVRRAGEESEKIRQEASAGAARAESEAIERMEGTRRELLEKAEREAAELKKSILDAAESEMLEWEKRYGQRQAEVLERVCRILRREEH